MNYISQIGADGFIDFEANILIGENTIISNFIVFPLRVQGG
jgi:hypothetical protein